MTDWVEMRSADMHCRWAAGAALCLFTFSYHCIVGKKNLTVYMAVMSAVYIKLERICNSSKGIQMLQMDWQMLYMESSKISLLFITTE